jgi:Ca2+:H+ antiporter
MAAQPQTHSNAGHLDSDVVLVALTAGLWVSAIASHFFLSGTWTFILCAAALIPLARFMGEATEVVAHRLGAGLGGLMNASFGNAAELIIGLVALQKGELAVVKASITGAVIGNICLVLGGAILAGGIRRSRQTFSAGAVLAGSSMMFLAVVALGIPDLFHVTLGAAALPLLRPLSVGISIVLLIIYGLSLLFSLKTHRYIYASSGPSLGPSLGPSVGEGGGKAVLPDEEDLPHWSLSKAVMVLLIATVGVVVVAEFLVGAIEPAIESFGFTHTFIGVVVVAIVGNAAEHATAIQVALRDKMDLAFNIAFESSKQIAMFVAPVLVLTSLALGHPLTLEFSHLEVAGMGVGIAGATLIALDGETNWLEGVMLLGVYVILAVTFFYVP